MVIHELVQLKPAKFTYRKCFVLGKVAKYFSSERNKKLGLFLWNVLLILVNVVVVP